MYRIAEIDARVTHVATRIPFRYGIAEMTQAPHVVVSVLLETGEGRAWGRASEHLPPKWFTKDPDSAFADDVRDMVAVIEHAIAASDGLIGETAFDLWLRVQRAQDEWGTANDVPGLLSGLGAALVERALIDAACRALGLAFPLALSSGALGFDPTRIHPELTDPRLPRPTSRIAVRHTVGLSDALTDAEVVDEPGDGLPVSLEAVIRRYGVTHFKVKTAGDLDADLPRLERIVALAGTHGIDPWFTIDGNESMRTAEHFTTWAHGLLDRPALGPLLRERLLAVEQPFHRSIALGPEVGAALAEFREDLAVIVDESDDSVTTVRAAMDLGYAGGTYKGCKGVFRGLANAALVHSRGRYGRTVLTAEDLSTLPPFTVGQDLVAASAMGLTHIERNGHHYFGRLAPIDPTVGELALAAHPDAYRRAGDGAVRLRIEGGSIALDSLLTAPFGFAPDLDVAGLTLLSADAAVAGLAS